MTKEYLVISGVQENGQKFRPSDWSERLSSTLASFQADHRLRYSAGVQPCILGGERCLIVARWLETADPAAYEYVMGFAKANQLRIQMDRRSGERALSRDS
jgi:tRNA 2-selenouridine synthase SelU